MGALYQRSWKIRSLGTIEFVDPYLFINNLHLQSSGIITFLCKCHIVLSDALVAFFLDVVFFLFLYYHSFMRNQEGIKVELQKKVDRRICVRDIKFLTARPLFYVIFCCLLRLLPFPSDVLTE